jgi:hypothetical protein
MLQVKTELISTGFPRVGIELRGEGSLQYKTAVSR